MYRSIAALAAVLACAPVPAPTSPAHANAHPHSASASHAAADARLRGAMARVRGAVAAFEHARHGHMADAQVRALADHVDAQVARVFAECRLPPAADASLHVVLGTLLKASRVLRESPGDLAPVDAMERALADYARMFQDPPG